jgi:hypothetical protein
LLFSGRPRRSGLRESNNALQGLEASLHENKDSAVHVAPAVRVVALLGAYAQEAPMAVSPALPAGQVDPRLPHKLPEYLRGITPHAPVRLPPLTADEARPRRRGPLTSTGLRRSVSIDFARDGSTVIMPDGKAVWSVAITSPGGKRVRVHFRDFDALSGQVWVYAPGAEFALAPFTGKGIFGDGEFWSASVEGETAIVTLVRSSQSTPAHLPFTIDAITHQWTVQDENDSGQALQGPNTDDAASCNLDVSCYAAYSGFATAVARYGYIGDDGGQYVCSGSLINTTSGSFKPYFLTAHHCISTPTEARSMAVPFLYQTSTCNGPPSNPASLPQQRNRF